MPISKTLTVVNISHEVGEPKPLSVIGSSKFIPIYINKFSNFSVDLFDAQLDSKFADLLYMYKKQGLVKVLLDGVEMSLLEVGYLKYPIATGSAATDEFSKVGKRGVPDYLSDIYFSQSLEGHIVPVQKINDLEKGNLDLWSAKKISNHTEDFNIHRSIDDYLVSDTNLWSSSKIISELDILRGELGNVSEELGKKSSNKALSGHEKKEVIHRIISDSSVTPTNLWSASKIRSELDTKASADHYHTVNPRIVFKEHFIGDGSTSIFKISGKVANGSFSEGGWSISKVLITYPLDITGLEGNLIYNKVGIFKKKRISVLSINLSGVVTLDQVPKAGVGFYIWYWYEVGDWDVLEEYVRENHVSEMHKEVLPIPSFDEFSK